MCVWRGVHESIIPTIGCLENSFPVACKRSSVAFVELWTLEDLRIWINMQNLLWTKGSHEAPSSYQGMEVNGTLLSHKEHLESSSSPAC